LSNNNAKIVRWAKEFSAVCEGACVGFSPCLDAHAVEHLGRSLDSRLRELGSHAPILRASGPQSSSPLVHRMASFKAALADSMVALQAMSECGESCGPVLAHLSWLKAQVREPTASFVNEAASFVDSGGSSQTFTATAVQRREGAQGALTSAVKASAPSATTVPSSSSCPPLWRALVLSTECDGLLALADTELEPFAHFAQRLVEEIKRGEMELKWPDRIGREESERLKLSILQLADFGGSGDSGGHDQGSVAGSSDGTRNGTRRFMQECAKSSLQAPGEAVATSALRMVRLCELKAVAPRPSPSAQAREVEMAAIRARLEEFDIALFTTAFREWSSRVAEMRALSSDPEASKAIAQYKELERLVEATEEELDGVLRNRHDDSAATVTKESLIRSYSALVLHLQQFALREFQVALTVELGGEAKMLLALG